MANANIGHIKCPLSGQWGVVRLDKRGTKYIYSIAGKMTPNLPLGQAWIEENMIGWGQAGVPPQGVTVKELIHGAPPLVEVGRVDITEAREDVPVTVQTVTRAANDEPPKEQPKKTGTGNSLFDLLGG